MIYTKQSRKNESGPVALLNLGKRLGMNLSYRQYIKRFRTLCQCVGSKDPIANETDFDYAIKKVFGWVGPMTKLVAPQEKDFYTLLENDDFDGAAIRLTTGDYVVLSQLYNFGDISIVPYGVIDYNTLKSMFCQKGFTIWAIKSML